VRIIPHYFSAVVAHAQHDDPLEYRAKIAPKIYTNQKGDDFALRHTLQGDAASPKTMSIDPKTPFSKIAPSGTGGI
jgi:hypothetical protein